MPYDWNRLTDLGIPHVQDVGVTVYDEAPFDGVLAPTWFAGSDGTLWSLAVPFGSQCKQVASPGDITRVAVSPDGSIWCVDSRGMLWKMKDNSWSTVDFYGKAVKDVSVSADRTVWVLMANGIYYTLSSFSAPPTYHGVLLKLDAITGIAKPDEENPFGRAWGVSSTWGELALLRCETIIGWSGMHVQNVQELSVSANGTVWMTKTDKTVWTTTDGLTQLRAGAVGNITRIAAGIAGLAWAVSADGAAWSWQDRQSTRTRAEYSDPIHLDSRQEPAQV